MIIMKILLVGSVAFLNQIKEAEQLLKAKGHQVISPRVFDLPEPIPAELKLQSMKNFNRNLEWSEAILVMNYNKSGKPNYISANTLMEIGMAFNRSKKVYIK